MNMWRYAFLNILTALHELYNSFSGFEEELGLSDYFQPYVSAQKGHLSHCQCEMCVHAGNVKQIQFRSILCT